MCDDCYAQANRSPEERGIAVTYGRTPAVADVYRRMRDHGVDQETAVRDLDLVAAADVAALAGVEPVTVYRWIERHPAFPQPASRTSGGAVWHRADIIDWLEETGRHIRQARD